MTDPVPIPIIPVICDRCRAEGAAGDGSFSGIAELLDFEPVPRRARADGWTPEYQRAFIAALAMTGAPARAARAIGKHAFGAEQLRKAKGGRGFAAAWDAALDIYRERELARLRDNLSDLAGEQEQREASPFAGDAGMDGDDGGDIEYRDAVARIRMRLLNARRLYLCAIRGDPAKRAAWELLVGPVDWERATSLEPQDDEPEGMPHMRGPDMVICAEAGMLPEFTSDGPDYQRHLLEALAEMKAEFDREGFIRPCEDCPRRGAPSLSAPA